MASGDGHVPDFGLSDEEPVFGCEVAKENGPTQCTVAEVAALKTAKVTAAPVYQLPWTIQAGDQLATELGGNISSVVLAGIFSGNYQSVADIKSAMGIAPLAGDDTEGLKVCRRTNTSGTQAGHSHLWLGSAYCGTSTKVASFIDATFDDNNVANGFPANYTVVENSSSSNVENCVDGVSWPTAAAPSASTPWRTRRSRAVPTSPSTASCPVSRRQPPVRTAGTRSPR